MSTLAQALRALSDRAPETLPLIERLVAERRTSERVAVISSDTAIRETAGPMVERIPSRSFLRELAADRPPPPSPASRSKVEDRLDSSVRDKLERWRRER